jgi:hypothetical protein
MEMFFLFLRLAYEGTVHVELGHDSKRMPMSAVMHANIKGHKPMSSLVLKVGPCLDEKC